jgi:RNA polymerase sigma factor (TIGR02999 family)
MRPFQIFCSRNCKKIRTGGESSCRGVARSPPESSELRNGASSRIQGAPSIALVFRQRRISIPCNSPAHQPKCSRALHVMGEVTQILQRVQDGERHSSDELLSLLYDELRRLAAAQLARERPGQTLQPTALVHEAWLRLVISKSCRHEPDWDNRRHFFAAAAEAMRRILIEKARRKKRIKHGGGLERVRLDEANVAAMMPSEQLLALDDALQGLEQADPEAAQLVKLRFYAGLTHEKASETLGISRRTADRLWAFGRAWLYEALRGENCGGEVQRLAKES